MKIRLGFVAMSLKLEDASPSKTVTYKRLQQLPDDEAKLYRLKKLTGQNLYNTLRILRHAQVHGIEVYRFTSKLVPLATHMDVLEWDYTREFNKELSSIGSFVKKHCMRVSAHPDHFTLLNSPKDEVTETSLRDLHYHDSLFNAMGLGKNAKLVMHAGGYYSDKENALNRFEKNYKALPSGLRSRIIIENDDRSYTATEVLKLCDKLGIPMVLDVHHHNCNPGGEKLEQLIPNIFNTWEDEELPPKIHFSSPLSPKKCRSHADDINPDDFVRFLEAAGPLNRDFDIMLEAKNKDMALFNLTKTLKSKYNINFIDKATIQY